MVLRLLKLVSLEVYLFRYNVYLLSLSGFLLAELVTENLKDLTAKVSCRTNETVLRLFKVSHI